MAQGGWYGIKYKGSLGEGMHSLALLYIHHFLSVYSFAIFLLFPYDRSLLAADPTLREISLARRRVS